MPACVASSSHAALCRVPIAAASASACLSRSFSASFLRLAAITAAAVNAESRGRTILPGRRFSSGPLWSAGAWTPRLYRFHCREAGLLSKARYEAIVCKVSHSSLSDGADDGIPSDPDDVLSAVAHRDLLPDSYLLPSGGHRVLVIQIDFKWGPKRMKPGAAEHRMSESCALIHSIRGWKVVKQCIVPLKHDTGRRQIFGAGKFVELAELVARESDVTAVFVDVETLNAEQLKTLQNAWQVPVYDRYTVVLQIFQLYAKSREARLQVALAEIPYLKSRLHGMHDSSLMRQRGGLQSVGGSGETLLHTRLQLLKENEAKLKSALAKIQERRQVLRSQRKKLDLPIVAVVGYTNAGKTSIIRVLTRDEKLVPEDRLFATLDITAHQGVLPSGMPVVYMDTVGFISDIPTALIAAFSATLEDVAHADVVMHLRDISHPDSEQQKQSVLASLEQLGLPARLMQNVVEVCNKTDLVSPEELQHQLAADCRCLPVSAETGHGVVELKQMLESTIVGVTGRMQLQLRLPPTGEELSWLYREGSVRDVQTDSDGWLVVDVVLSKQAYGKYGATFGLSCSDSPRRSGSDRGQRISRAARSKAEQNRRAAAQAKPQRSARRSGTVPLPYRVVGAQQSESAAE